MFRRPATSNALSATRGSTSISGRVKNQFHHFDPPESDGGAVGKKDARIDAYIDNAGDFARPILRHIRQLVHANCPDLEETLKWRFPHFTYKGLFCHMAAFKEHCSLGFWYLKLGDEFKVANDDGEVGMGQFGKIKSLSDLPSDAKLKELIKRAMKLNESGVKPPPRAPKKAPKKKLEIPDHFMKALSKDKKALASFENLSPSCQREYVEWITQAKREETFAKRLATMKQWLSEGKSLNWKYQK
jgi:uncharacterized protein YdeI (YjbR/CyaY-like superfamily)